MKRTIEDFFKKEIKPSDVNVSIVSGTAENLRGEIAEQMSSSSRAEDIFIENDIARYVGKNLDDQTKTQLLTRHWAPPANYDFPFSLKTYKDSQVRRHASHQHLALFDWLVLSPSAKGFFCKYCPLFVPGLVGGFQNNVSLGFLVVKPLTKFSNLLGKDGYLVKHQSNSYHVRAVEASKDFLNRTARPNLNVLNLQNQKRLAEVKENRERLLPIVKTIIFCGHQGLALRGHREATLEKENEGSSVNSGNFRELLKFRIDAGDNQLREHLEKASSRATYISPTVQNDLIECCQDVILEEVLLKVRAAGFYSIMFDETTYVSHQSQLSLVLRFVTNGEVREDFLKFINVHQALYEDIEGEELQEPKVTGNYVGKLVVEALLGHGLDIDKCVGVATYGCSMMVSESKGAVRKVQETCKNALRIPCYNHALNLSLCKSADVQAARNAFGIITEVNNFFTASAKRHFVLKKFGPSIIGLCETRWVERHEAVMHFAANLIQIVECLNNIAQWNEIHTASKARTLVSSVCNAEFVVALFCLEDVLGVTIGLSRTFQKRSLNVSAAANMLSDTTTLLKKQRSDCEEQFSRLFARITEACDLLDVTVSIPRIAGRQTHRQKFAASTPEAYFRITIYNALLDSVLEDLRSRFSPETLNVYNLSFLFPANCPSSEANEKIKAIAEQYATLFSLSPEVFIRLLSSEFEIWSQQCSRGNYGSVDLAYMACDKEVFPIIYQLLNILLCLPVSVASAERSFSVLNRLKSWIRSTISQERLNGLALLLVQERLNGLALLLVHRDDVKVDPEEVVQRFALKKSRRLNFAL